MKLYQYWKSLNFDYLKTFSCLRNGDFKSEIFKDISETSFLIKGLEYRKLNSRDEDDLVWCNEQLENFNYKLETLNEYVISEDAKLISNEEFNVTAIEMFNCSKNDTFINQLDEIFSIPFKQEDALMCWPVYRDAIVFYDSSNNITEALQICFGCISIINIQSIRIQTDISIYEPFKNLLISVGHKVYND